MESRHYLLPSDSHPRLELVCGTNWRYVHINVDGAQIGSIKSAGDLLQGAEFFLPEGDVLTVKLLKQVGTSELRVAVNGRVLNKTGLDRTNRDVRTAYQAVLAIGGVNLLFFCLTLLDSPSATNLRWYDFAFGVAFLFLGWLIREGSGVALTFALVIYLVDTLITLIAIFSYRYYIALLDLSINIVLLFFMLRGYGSIGKAVESFRMFSGMLREPSDKPRPSLPTRPSLAALPAPLQRVDHLLHQAIAQYAGGNRERALALVKEALQLAPNLADGWYVLAYLVEQPEDRLRALERVLSLNPFHAGAQDALDKLRRGRDFVDGLLG
ncbi:MAG: hypothetical protein KF716_05390 [Anaerolineae bacterium]|nr:hypothetical protein [Anaerolineae bacterium]